MNVADPKRDTFAAIAERVAHGARLVAVARMTGGVSAHVHELTLEDDSGPRRVVVRQHGAADWKPSHGEVTAREYDLLRVLHALGMPVPQPLLLDTSATLLDGPFFVMSHVAGTVEVADGEVDACIDVMADTLARLHSLPTGGMPELPVLVDPLPELYDYLPDAAEWQPVRDLLEGLGSTAYEGAKTLLHGDFWPGNLLWREGRLVGILDWEDASLGDPLSDLAGCRIEMLWRYGEAARDRFTRRYERARPVEPARLALWDLFVGLAAAHFMDKWGLAPAREQEMRTRAQLSVRAAAAVLLG